MKLLKDGILKRSSVLSKDKPQGVNKLYHISLSVLQLKSSWYVIGITKK